MKEEEDAAKEAFDRTAAGPIPLWSTSEADRSGRMLRFFAWSWLASSSLSLASHNNGEQALSSMAWPNHRETAQESGAEKFRVSSFN